MLQFSPQTCKKAFSFSDSFISWFCLSEICACWNEFAESVLKVSVKESNVKQNLNNELDIIVF